MMDEQNISQNMIRSQMIMLTILQICRKLS